VLYYGKFLENRRWNTNIRGEFLLHAALGMKEDEYREAEDFIARALRWTEPQQREAFAQDFKARDQRGGIVGRARLVDVIPPCEKKNGAQATLFPCPHPWHMPKQYAFVLENVEPTRFVPLKGLPGFFNVPDSIVAEALRAA
jgi:hypothetical protein